MNGPRTVDPGGWQHRREQRAQLLRFAQQSRCAQGFGYLGDDGQIVPSRPVSSMSPVG